MQGSAAEITNSNLPVGDNWTPVTGLLHWADTQPDSVYLVQPVDGEVTEYSWLQVAEQVRAMANHLVGLELPEGSCIVIRFAVRQLL